MKQWGLVCLLLPLLVTPAAITQTRDTTAYGGRQTFAAFFDYSNDSSHIALGTARNRKFTELGFQYEYRLKANRKMTWKYTGEFRPLIAERDVTTSAFVTLNTPVITETFYEPPTATVGCVAGSRIIPIGPPAFEMIDTMCGHRWTYVEGISPLGTRINLRPRSRWQPTASLITGLLLSAKRIPIDTAGSFNFTFQLGAGVEYFRTPTQSIRLEYQLQHFSNAYTAQTNPGVDDGLFKVTYAFGR
jgi:opacity protein-like surface antigen